MKRQDGEMFWGDESDSDDLFSSSYHLPESSDAQKAASRSNYLANYTFDKEQSDSDEDISNQSDSDESTDISDQDFDDLHAFNYDRPTSSKGIKILAKQSTESLGAEEDFANTVEAIQSKCHHRKLVAVVPRTKGVKN